MNGTGSLLGAALALGAMIGRAEARMVHYEINGQRYSYSSNNRAQVAEARQRIEAASTADAAKRRADTELAGNPLLKIVGSPAQREAAEAQARLQKLLSEEQRAAAPFSPASARGADRKRQVRQALVKGETRSRSPMTKLPWPSAQLRSGPAQQKPAVKAVTFDLSSGIKTVQMTDGTIHEQPFDSSTLSKLGSMEPATESLTTFVEQVRSRAGEERTAETTLVPERAKN